MNARLKVAPVRGFHRHADGHALVIGHEQNEFLVVVHHDVTQFDMGADRVTVQARRIDEERICLCHHQSSFESSRYAFEAGLRGAYLCTGACEWCASSTAMLSGM